MAKAKNKKKVDSKKVEEVKSIPEVQIDPTATTYTTEITATDDVVIGMTLWSQDGGFVSHTMNPEAAYYHEEVIDDKLVFVRNKNTEEVSDKKDKKIKKITIGNTAGLSKYDVQGNQMTFTDGKVTYNVEEVLSKTEMSVSKIEKDSE